MQQVGMLGIGGVVAASAAVDAAGVAMQAGQAASALITSAVMPPSSDPGSATATVQMAAATADMTAKSLMAFGAIEVLGAFVKTQALGHAAADAAGTAALVSTIV
ncbi:hypothetical protein MUG78_17055 [Gordonia alkaliphila]|uniref:hypothetical protein n=1 Tax=Gordonia alkaliphila TaxID=1053547 RepID=UPI001FF0EF4F|nr:hypothetical protein [Gordonia alkaliphila]MCK0441110.1 hypothetical protein [Gordonia alkaliphila]